MDWAIKYSPHAHTPTRWTMQKVTERMDGQTDRQTDLGAPHSSLLYVTIIWPANQWVHPTMMFKASSLLRQSVCLSGHDSGHQIWVIFLADQRTCYNLLAFQNYKLHWTNCQMPIVWNGWHVRIFNRPLLPCRFSAVASLIGCRGVAITVRIREGLRFELRPGDGLS